MLVSKFRLDTCSDIVSIQAIREDSPCPEVIFQGEGDGCLACSRQTWGQKEGGREGRRERRRVWVGGRRGRKGGGKEKAGGCRREERRGRERKRE